MNLGAQGKYQTRRRWMRGRSGAKVPGSVDFTIGRAIVVAHAVLTPTPQIVADAQVADVRYGAVVLSAARAKVNYVGGHGTAQALVTGIERRAVPPRRQREARAERLSARRAGPGQRHRFPHRESQRMS